MAKGERIKCERPGCWEWALVRLNGIPYCSDCYSEFYPPYFNITHRDEIKKYDGMSIVDRIKSLFSGQSAGEEYGI